MSQRGKRCTHSVKDLKQNSMDRGAHSLSPSCIRYRQGPARARRAQKTSRRSLFRLRDSRNGMPGTLLPDDAENSETEFRKRNRRVAREDNGPSRHPPARNTCNHVQQLTHQDSCVILGHGSMRLVSTKKLERKEREMRERDGTHHNFMTSEREGISVPNHKI